MTIGEFFTVANLSTPECMFLFVLPFAFIVIGNIIFVPVRRHLFFAGKYTTSARLLLRIMFNCLKVGAVMIMTRFFIFTVWGLADWLEFLIGLSVALVFGVCDIYLCEYVIHKEFKKPLF